VKKSIVQLSVAVAGILLPAAAFALSVGGGVPGVAVIPNSAESYNGPHFGVEVQGWLYPVGMKPPAGAPVIQGKVGSSKYAMLLTSELSTKREIDPFGVDENDNLRSETAFRRTLGHKLVRIVTERRLSKQLDAELRSADRPIAVDGWVSDSPSPLLILSFIDYRKSMMQQFRKQLAQTRLRLGRR